MKQTKYIVKPTTQLTIEHRTAAGISSAAVSILFYPEKSIQSQEKQI